MVDRLKALWKDEDGPTMVEYALAVALIAVVAIIAFVAVGGATRDKMNDVSGEISLPR